LVSQKEMGPKGAKKKKTIDSRGPRLGGWEQTFQLHNWGTVKDEKRIERDGLWKQLRKKMKEGRTKKKKKKRGQKVTTNPAGGENYRSTDKVVTLAFK